MRHSIRMEGCVFRLRPVEMNDAAFILELRTDPQRRAFVHATPHDLSAQESWIREYFGRPGDYYFILESKQTERPEGTVGIYNIDPEKQCGEWGRWIVRPDSMGAVESASLIYSVAFERLGLRMVYARIAAGNKRAIAFQRSCGFDWTTVRPASLVLENGPSDSLEYRVTREMWDSRKPVFERQIDKIAKMRVSPGVQPGVEQ